MSQENPQPSTLPQTRAAIAEQLWMKHMNHGNSKVAHTHVVGAQFAAPTAPPPAENTRETHTAPAAPEITPPRNTPHPTGLTTEQLNYISQQRHGAPFPVRTKPFTPSNPSSTPAPQTPPSSSSLMQGAAARAMPGMAQMMKNIANTAGDVVKQAAQGGPIMVPEEVQKMRFDTCLACEFYDNAQGRCTKCGCFMKAKTNIAAATCPVQKWDKYTADQK